MEGCRLAVNDLACRRGDRVLFRGLSFELNPGEALQVVGPNGTGKSSLLRIVAGLLRPFAGTVERNSEVALLDDKLALDEHLPLGQAFEFWSRIDGCSYNPPRDGEVDPGLDPGDGGDSRPSAAVRAANPLHRLRRSPSPSRGGLGLDELTDVPVRFLSTGQRKRAGVLLSNTRQVGLWLLDEPLNGLDVNAAAEFQQRVSEYLAHGGAAIVASHQPFAAPGLRQIDLMDYAP